MECVIFMAFLGPENSGKEKDNFVDVVIYICYYNNGKEDYSRLTTLQGSARGEQRGLSSGAI